MMWRAAQARIISNAWGSILFIGAISIFCYALPAWYFNYSFDFLGEAKFAASVDATVIRALAQSNLKEAVDFALVPTQTPPLSYVVGRYALAIVVIYSGILFVFGTIAIVSMLIRVRVQARRNQKQLREISEQKAHGAARLATKREALTTAMGRARRSRVHEQEH
jgi:hypothetical protein